MGGDSRFVEKSSIFWGVLMIFHFLGPYMGGIQIFGHIWGGGLNYLTFNFVLRCKEGRLITKTY